MEELDYKPNSNKYKKEQAELQAKKKDLKPVVSGKTKRKKNEIRKFTDIFFADDWESIKSYIKDDILIPAAKKAFYDVVEGSLSMSLFGGRGGGPSRRSNIDKVSYRDYSASSRKDERRSDNYRSRSVLDYDDILFSSKGDAELVLTRLIEALDTYETVSIADFYDLSNVSDIPHTANNYGWDNLSKAYVDRVRDGYIIRFPKVRPISSLL